MLRARVVWIPGFGTSSSPGSGFARSSGRAPQFSSHGRPNSA
jgi:hypothetical protein